MAVVVVASFFFKDTAPTEIYTLSLHDALPILLVMETSSIISGIDFILTQTFGDPYVRDEKKVLPKIGLPLK